MGRLRGYRSGGIIGRIVYDDNFTRIGRVINAIKLNGRRTYYMDLVPRLRRNGSMGSIVRFEEHEIKGINGEVTLSLTIDDLVSENRFLTSDEEGIIVPDN